MDSSIKPVRAQFQASGSDDSAQLKTFDVRKLNAQGAIYYITEIPVNHREALKFPLRQMANKIRADSVAPSSFILTRYQYRNQ
jgi:hypothetical protein